MGNCRALDEETKNDAIPTFSMVDDRGCGSAADVLWQS
jgi:hypothetical protein